MILSETLQWIYDQELNCEISSFWDGGWEFRLGDEGNGYKERQDCFYDLDSGAKWLLQMVEKHYGLKP